MVAILSNRPPRLTPGHVSGALAAVVVATLLGACGSGSTPAATPPGSAVTSPAVTSPGATSPAPSAASTTSSPGSTTRATGPTATATHTGRQLAISVTGRTITPSPAQMDLGVGETLTLIVTIDHDDRLHAHGFEIEKTLPAGTPTTIVLTGAEPGVYEVETHEPALTLLTIAVR